MFGFFYVKTIIIHCCKLFFFVTYCKTKAMKYFLLLCFISVLIFSCNTTKKTAENDSDPVVAKEQDTVRIANDELEYEIIIIDPGFNSWLFSRARPRGFYDQIYFESRNRVLVNEWNQRVLQPSRYNPNLYEMQINYEHNINYGYEVNYLLYNYFLYFQLNYNQRLSSFVPRI